MNLVRLYARTLSMLGPERKLGMMLATANFTLACAVFVEPMLFGRIIDALADAQIDGTTSARPGLINLILAWGGLGLFVIITSVVVALYADRLAHRRRQAVLTDFFGHVLRLPLLFHNTIHSGRLLKVMLAGTDALWMLWFDFFRDFFAAGASLLVLLPFAIYLNWLLGLMMLTIALVFAILTALVINKTETMQRAVERHYLDIAERASDALGNIALVQSFTYIEAEIAGLRTIADRLLAAQIPVLSWWAVVAAITRASTTLTLLAILLVGVLLHFQGRATIGDLVMFMGFAGMLIGQLEKFVRFVNKVFMEAPRLHEFFTLLDTELTVLEAFDAIDVGPVRGHVEFKNVTFAYDGKRPAVSDLTFTALPGETIALVGVTGAGKSTALALLNRAFDPQIGKIEIDGNDIRAIKLAALRRNIGVVHQQSLLLNRTVEENLRVGKPDATEAEMRDAATRARAIDFIDQAADAFRMRVGERGSELSGGERQRLSIARAILKDPPILILDEATSALDAETEGTVQAALDELMRGRTTFVIAHRLSTVRNATRILVFEHGRIVEIGAFEELIRAGGRFAALAKEHFNTADAFVELRLRAAEQSTRC